MRGTSLNRVITTPLASLLTICSPNGAVKREIPEKFTLEVADRIGGDQGDFLYFQLATSLICGCGDEPNLSWAKNQTRV